ncbi:type IV toxin-antitoxin system AbiEi family antitoxin domain-containing protein [Phycicoccus avicenniae]|uniref:type IV toxin-antitoxin system AbiEi family antitoxin domain-containing protein n=1 Tax=Phycicoccus avicenniae TaxID=2828860 RepID=UPI003D2DB610
MDPADVVRRLGGIAGRHEVVDVVGRSALHRAVADGSLVRVARGRYALPVTAPARAAAQQLTGTAMLLSAAAHWGWALKAPPELPQVAVPRGRKVPDEARALHDVRWRDVPAHHRVDGWVTSPVRTVHDCCALLPFDEALCVVDSALRDHDTDLRGLHDLDDVPGRLRRRVGAVLDAGSELAHGPFESVVRAVALGVPGLHVRPQVAIRDVDGFVGRVDLADERLRIVIEADSSEFHSGAADFARDCERYSRLSVDGWLVVRVPWRMAMSEPDRLHRLLVRAVASRSRCTGCFAA